ncbi:MAG: hypothetical protein ABF289_04235 [Clostridiales bacterium]
MKENFEDEYIKELKNALNIREFEKFPEKLSDIYELNIDENRRNK